MVKMNAHMLKQLGICMLSCALVLAMSFPLLSFIPVDNPNLEKGADAELLEYAFDQSEIVDDLIVRVQAKSGVLPEDATLQVRSVSLQQVDMFEEVVASYRNDDEQSAALRAFDITVVDAQGNEVQPRDDQEVHISIESSLVSAPIVEPRLFHVPENDFSQIEQLETDVVASEARATSDGFSYYAVDFVYNNLQYRLSGDQRTSLQTILEALGIEGSIESATTSHPELFSIELNQGEYVVVSHASFATPEWLEVVLTDGQMYHIDVFDPEISDPAVIQDGSYAIKNFARSGDIATIHIDTAKLTNGIFSADGNFAESTSTVESGIFAAYTGPIEMKSVNEVPGSFSYTFPNAAILQDGTTADVKMTFSNIYIHTHTTEKGPYSPSVTFLARNDGVIAIGNLAPNPVHTGVQMDSTVEIIGADGTFYYTLYGVNNTRTGTNFSRIAGTDPVYGWNERFVFNADDVYVPSNGAENFVNVDGKTTMTPSTGASDTNFNSGFASLADASGFTGTSWGASGGGWSSGGRWTQNGNVKISPMQDSVIRRVVSSSAPGGRVDTNKQGTVTTPAEALTKAGSSGVDSLSVPIGKDVVYTLTPECGYILDTFTVDGREIVPMPVKNSDGKIEYYTYTLPGGTDANEHVLHATWQESINIKIIKQIEGKDALDEPVDIGFYVGTQDLTHDKDGSIDKAHTATLTSYANNASSVPNYVVYAGISTIQSLNQEITTIYDLPKFEHGEEVAYYVNEFGLDATKMMLKEVSVDAESECGTRVYTFTNIEPMVTLKIKKEVTGNAGDKTKKFDFNIQYFEEDLNMQLADTDAYEATIPLRNVQQGDSFDVYITEDCDTSYTTTMRSNVAVDISSTSDNAGGSYESRSFVCNVQDVSELEDGDVYRVGCDK